VPFWPFKGPSARGVERRVLGVRAVSPGRKTAIKGQGRGF
jgi:hypothetical protein